MTSMRQWIGGRWFGVGGCIVLLGLLVIADRFVAPSFPPEWRMLVVLAGAGGVFLCLGMIFISIEVFVMVRRRRYR